MFEDKPIPELDMLPLAQLRLLWTIHHRRDGTMKDFSERLSVSQSTVTQLADRLVRRGFVERHADPTDRRVVRLRTSSLGNTLLQKAKSQQQHIMESVWAALTEPEQEQVMRGLEALALRSEQVRAAEGRPLPPWPEKPMQEQDIEPGSSDSAGTQTVVDLMTRRVRGRTTSDR